MMTRRRMVAAAASLPVLAAHDRAGDISRFSSDEFESGHIRKRFYKRGTGPAVLLLHELPGLMPEDIALGERLSSRYTVYMPLFFGKAGDSSCSPWLSFTRVVLGTPCWGAEFDCNSNHSSGTILGWIEAFTSKIDEWHKGQGVGVIGNCLTGAVPMALMARDTVKPKLRCAVMSQPAIPTGVFGKHPTQDSRTSFGLPEAVVKKAAASGVPTLVFRFVDDPYVPKERMQALVSMFPKDPAKFEYYPVNPDAPACHESKCDHHHHAVLSMGYCSDPATNGNKAYVKLMNFLSAHMGA